MSESETGISDLFADMDLEETNDTGYEQDVDVEIIDGFYHQNVAFMNEKVQVFADYWMKLYSNCCLQRDYAVELLNDKKPEEAKAILQDWPDTCGAPYIPQLLCETPVEPKRKKRSALSIECDAVSLIHQMKENYITGNRVHFDVPNVLPEGQVSLLEYEHYIKRCDDCFKNIENYVIENYVIQNAFVAQSSVREVSRRQKKQVHKCYKL